MAKRRSREAPAPRRTLVRSPIYVLRALVGAALILVAVLLFVTFEGALLGLRTDVAAWREGLPDWLTTGVEVVFATALVLAVLGTNAYLLANRKYRRWLVVNFAAIVAIVLVGGVASALSSLAPSPALRDVLTEPAGETGALGNEALASLVAVLTVAGPWMTRRLRPWAGGLVASALVLSFFGRAIGLITLPLDVGVGILSGALVALIVMTPDQTPTREQVVATLGVGGMAVTDVARATTSGRGSVRWLVTIDGGERLVVETVGADQRAADLLYRLYRWARFRNAGDHHPFISLRRAVEHRALLSLAAASRGIRTPQLVTVAEIGETGWLLAYRRLDGSPVPVAAAALSDSMLDSIWRLVGELHRCGIAHRNLRLANVVAAEDGEPWLVDFGFAELAAGEDLQARDIAELLASTSAATGVDRATASAVHTLGTDRVAGALPWIQPLALGSATRAEVGKSDDFKRLRGAVSEAVGITEVKYQRIERVSSRTILLMASLGLTIYILVPQLADASGFVEEVRHARVGWVLLAALASAVTYVGAAVGMVGAIPVRLRIAPVIAAQLASSFSNRVTPAKVGGMATNVRFLQKRGMTTAVAVSAVGLNTVAGFVVHVVLLTLTLTLVGRSGDVELPLPSSRTAVVVVVALLLTSGLLMLLPAGRRMLVRNLLPALKAAGSSLATIARAPTKLLALFAGTALLTLSYATAMVASLYAFGSDVGLASAVAVYLAGSAVAMAAPTPGGVGATEAALVAGYTAVGVDAGIAFAAVLLFRLVTFWLPILPGWWALIALQRRGDL